MKNVHAKKQLNGMQLYGHVIVFTVRMSAGLQVGNINDRPIYIQLIQIHYLNIFETVHATPQIMHRWWTPGWWSWRPMQPIQYIEAHQSMQVDNKDCGAN